MRTYLALATVVAAVTACAGDKAGKSAAESTAIAPVGSAAPQMITITARNFAYDAPDTVSSGMVTIKLVNQGLILAEMNRSKTSLELQDYEFKVFSQWGEDGIIAHLLAHVPITNTIFVEFGVQDYSESNTRFLLRHRNWSGLVLDGSSANIALIRADPIYWRHNLKAEAAFITRDNINDLLIGHGISGGIGLLSVDIDGNDYWVWEAITAVAPQLVVAEYNALFGPTAPVSVPYEPSFERTAAHHSNLYWGCSLAALVHLGVQKGYRLVGCNSNGNNAFFVRSDCSGSLPSLTASQAFRPAKFRESRSAAGELTHLSGPLARAAVAHMPLTDVVSGKTLAVGDLAVQDVL